MHNEMPEESKDCWQCKLISGGGVLGAGAYVVYHGKKAKTFSRHIITSIGYGLCALGILRIFGFPPFKSSSKESEKVGEENLDKNEYIIGKFN